MADRKISELPVAGSAADSDEYAINQSGTSKSLTNSKIITLFLSVARVFQNSLQVLGTFIPSIGSSVTSQTTLALTPGNTHTVTGNATIASLGTSTTGTVKVLRFAASGAILTHSDPGLVLPGSTNYTTIAGDVLTFQCTDGAAGNWSFINAQGAPITPGIAEVVDDTTPQLGGNLDVNGNAIVSASNGDIDLSPNGTGVVNVDAPLSVDNEARYTAQATLDNTGASNWNIADDPEAKLLLPTSAFTVTITDNGLNSSPAMHFQQHGSTPREITIAVSGGSFEWAGGEAPDFATIDLEFIFTFKCYNGTDVVGTWVQIGA